jgi:hypothetical protein
LRVDDGDIGSLGEQTILASDRSYQVLQGFETCAETPLLVKRIKRLAYARGPYLRKQSKAMCPFSSLTHCQTRR